MNDSAPTLRSRSRLRVAIITTEPQRRAELIELLIGAAHAVVATIDEADVVLCVADVLVRTNRSSRSARWIEDKQPPSPATRLRRKSMQRCAPLPRD